ncbi:hypothetical protein P389DRAFT_78776 [Cystobasidium minutum MCA 4210]|uniref:uncharacterized protein n=1 Tax=Cystobasidium minutum MCA 4210 TaxID=1397322 RepID=UPI0034CF53FF|eukprot:jgi/Rhomi1/78776/CE78775_68
MNFEAFCEALPRDHGIELGEGYAHTGFPHPLPVSAQEVQVNILYCKLKLQRLDATVTCLDKECFKWSVRGELELVLDIVAKAAKPANAAALTSFMGDLLQLVQPLANFRITSHQLSSDFMIRIFETVKAGALRLWPIFSDDARALSEVDLLICQMTEIIKNCKKQDAAIKAIYACSK